MLVLTVFLTITAYGAQNCPVNFCAYSLFSTASITAQHMAKVPQQLLSVAFDRSVIRTAYIHRLTFLALNRPRQTLFMTAPGWMPACTITVTRPEPVTGIHFAEIH